MTKVGLLAPSGLALAEAVRSPRRGWRLDEKVGNGGSGFLKTPAVPSCFSGLLLREPLGRTSSGRGYWHVGHRRPGRKALFEELNLVGSNGAAQS